MQPHERLRQARERAGYIRGSDAARAFGWPVSTYLGHENGSRGLTKDAAERYAKAFKVTWEWLLGGNEAEATHAETGTPIYWEAEYDAFRRLSPVEREHCDTIPVGVWGYDPTTLFAVTVRGRSNFYLICENSSSLNALFENDQIVIERRDENGRAEIAVWEVIIDREGVPRLRPLQTGLQSARALTFSELRGTDHSVHGRVVAEYMVFQRKHPIDVEEEEEDVS